MTTMLGPTSIDHFKNLHDHYLKKEPILARQLEARFNAAKSCLARVARWCFKGRRHEAEAFEIAGCQICL